MWLCPEFKVMKEMHAMIKKALSICLLLAMPIIAYGQQPEVVGCGAFPAGTPVTPYLIGQNYWFFSADSPDLPLSTIKSSGVTIIRIGGRTFDNTPLTDAQLLQQVDKIRSIGAEPLIQVSRHHTAGAAAATVQYINVANARNVKFWSIGNEPDLGFVGGEVQLAAEVAVYIKQISPAMRDVDPSITIIAPDMAFYSATKFNELLGGASDITGKDAQGRYYIDCVSFHRYGASTFTREQALNDMHSDFENNRVVPLVNRIAFANSLNDRTGSAALKWALTEFNILTANPPNFSGDTRINNPAGYGVSSFFNGQFFAEYYRVAMKRGVAFMNSWSIREGGGNGSAGDLGYLGGNINAPVPRSSYYHMQMIANYLLPGGYLPSASSAPNLAVLSTSAKCQTRLAVMLLNEETTGSQEYTIRMNDEPAVGGGTKINVSARLAKEYSGTLDNQTTSVLIFDESGALKKRVTYSLARHLVNLEPLVETFTGNDTAPATPAGLVVTSSDAQALLSWSAPSETTGYNIKRAQVSGGPYQTIASGVITTSYTDTGLANDSTYYYVVSAVNSFGESANCFEAVAAPQATTAPITFEAENISFTSVGASTSVNPDTPASGGRWVQLNSNAAGQWMEFTTGSIPAGTWALQLTYKVNPNRGQLSLSVDGAQLGGIVDQFASGATAGTFVTRLIGSVTFASAGAHTLRLTCVGRNSASTGFLLSADKFTFAGRTTGAVALDNLNQTYDGAPKAVSVTTTPAGLNTSITYNGISAAPTDVGVYSVMARINDAIHVGSASGTLLVRLPATLSLGDFDREYDGAPKVVTVTTNPTGLSVQCSYDGSTVAPTEIGNYVVVCSVTDANYTGSVTGMLTIRDTTPPKLRLPADITVEATSPAGAIVAFTASANDIHDCSVPIILSHAPGGAFPIGTTIVTASATDTRGNVATGSFVITVRDTTAPLISGLSASPDSIWPPNHKMVLVTLTALVTDEVDSAPVTSIVSVTSESKHGSKQQGAWEITGPLTVKLRAVQHTDYSITVESRDRFGNVSARSVMVRVEHD
jgi:MBG domain/HYR domain/Fibronectin type III domain/Carbohydrate binding module (family 35)